MYRYCLAWANWTAWISSAGCASFSPCSYVPFPSCIFCAMAAIPDDVVIVVFLAGGLAVFALAAGYAALCERL